MKIPNSAKKVFSGVIFDIYQWQQEMFDGSKATYETAKRKPSLSIIALTPDKQILLLDQEQPARPPFPSLPGGKIEDNEEPSMAAARELLEETGYRAKEIILLNEYNDDSKIDFTDYLYLAKDCLPVSDQNLDPGEKITVKLVDFQTLLETVKNPLFAIPRGFQYELWEALLDPQKKEMLRKKLSL